MANKKIFILLTITIITSLLLIQSAQAIGLRGTTLNYRTTYDNTPITLEYEFANALSPNVEIITEGTIAPHVTLSQEEFSSKSGMFSATVEFPSDTQGGSYSGKICAGETQSSGSGAVSVLTKSCALISVTLLYDAATLTADLQLTRNNDYATATYSVSNYGRASFTSSTTTINLEDANGNVLQTFTDSNTNKIESTKSHTYSTNFNIANLEPTTYYIKATASADGQTITNSKELNVGEEKISASLTTSEIEKDGLQKVTVNLENHWYESLESYAEVKIASQTIKSSTEEIPAWREKTTTAVIDTDELSLGEVPVTITTYWGEGKSQSQTETLTIVEKKAEVSQNQKTDSFGTKSKIYLFTVSGIIIVLLITLISMKYRKGQDEGEF